MKILKIGLREDNYEKVIEHGGDIYHAMNRYIDFIEDENGLLKCINKANQELNGKLLRRVSTLNKGFDIVLWYSIAVTILLAFGLVYLFIQSL